MSSHNKCLVLVVVKGIAHPSLPLILIYIGKNEQDANAVCQEFLFKNLVGWRLQVFDPVSFSRSYPLYIERKGVTAAICLDARNLGEDLSWLDGEFDDPTTINGLQEAVSGLAATHQIKNETGVVDLPWLLFQDREPIGLESEEEG